MCWARDRGLSRSCAEGADVMLDIPVVMQKDDISCGPACVRAVLRYWKVKGGQAPAADAMDGVHPYLLDGAFRAAGLKVFAGEMGADDLRDATRRGKPVVCLVRADSDGHWLVVRGLSRGRVYYMDPDQGLGSETVESFTARWHDVDRHGSEFRGWAIVPWRP